MERETSHDLFESRFNKSPEFGLYNRDLSLYRACVFHDDFVENPSEDQPYVISHYRAHQGEPDRQNTMLSKIEPIEGGFEGFIKNGKDLLDLGSGSGLALSQMALKNPEKRFVGFDFRYVKDAPPPADLPNIQLVGGTWFELPFKNDTFDRVLSVYTFPYHLGRSKTDEKSNEDLAKEAISEITRVCKQGALWRGNLSGKTQVQESWRSGDLFPRLVTEQGWELTTLQGNDGEVFIAKLAEKNSQQPIP